VEINQTQSHLFPFTIEYSKKTQNEVDIFVSMSTLKHFFTILDFKFTHELFIPQDFLLLIA